MVNVVEPHAALLEAWARGNLVRRTPGLEVWLERLGQGQPTILPRLSAQSLILYGVASSPARARGLASEMLAAIGPSWSDFTGASCELDVADDFEQALARYQEASAAGPVLRARVRADADRTEVWAALQRLLDAWQRRPHQDSRVVEPVARLLTDFELSLQAGAVDEASELLEAIQSRGELSSDNLLFLEVRILGASGRFHEVLKHPRLEQIVNGRRPSRVNDLLFAAIHAEYLAVPAAQGDAYTALEIFEREVRPRFGSLLRSRGPLESLPAIESLLLAAVADGRPRAEREALASAAATSDDRERAWLEALVALADEVGAAEVPISASTPAGTEVALDPTALAQELLLEARFDDVVDVLRDAPATLANTQLLLQAAAQADTLDAASAVATVFASLSEEAQESLRRIRLWADPLERLLAIAGTGSALSSWHGWLSALAAGDVPHADEIVARGALEWDPGSPATVPEAEALAALMLGVPEERRAVLQRAIPHVVAFIERRARPPEVRAPIDVAVFDLLVYGDSHGRSVQEMLLAVLDGVLQAGPEPERYRATIADLAAVWDGIRSPRTFDWLLDVIALLAQHACPDVGARAALFQRAVGEAVARRDLDRVTADMLEAIAEDLELPDSVAPLAARKAETSLPTPTGAVIEAPAVIGIYTLTESSAHRAREALQRLFPETTVELNHEHDSSPILTAFAGRANVLAMVIASAKHAATDAIRRACPPERLVEVSSRGSTAIVRAVVDHVADPEAAAV